MNIFFWLHSMFSFQWGTVITCSFGDPTSAYSALPPDLPDSFEWAADGQIYSKTILFAFFLFSNIIRFSQWHLFSLHCDPCGKRIPIMVHHPPFRTTLCTFRLSISTLFWGDHKKKSIVISATSTPISLTCNTVGHSLQSIIPCTLYLLHPWKISLGNCFCFW